MNSCVAILVCLLKNSQKKAQGTLICTVILMQEPQCFGKIIDKIERELYISRR